MATKEEITAIRTEYASVYDYHSDALVEAMAAVIADTRRAYLAASQTITKLTDERDALLDQLLDLRPLDDTGLPSAAEMERDALIIERDVILDERMALLTERDALRVTVGRVRNSIPELPQCIDTAAGETLAIIYLDDLLVALGPV